MTALDGVFKGRRGGQQPWAARLATGHRASIHCTPRLPACALPRRMQVTRLVLPPTHTLALVEYAEPQDAR